MEVAQRGSAMRTFDLSVAAVQGMTRVDLATVTEEPPSAIGDFDFPQAARLWRPYKRRAPFQPQGKS
jgi:hypothetical protein